MGRYDTEEKREKSRARIRAHYRNNKDYYLQKNRRRRLELQDFLRDLKSSTPCVDCQKIYPYYVMDFDHLRDKAKVVSRIVRSGSMTLLMAEIAKCELVCANCHRLRTFSRIPE